MKNTPILFNQQNVLAILDGRKTHTRRVIPYKFWFDLDNLKKRSEFPCKYGVAGDTLWVKETWAEMCRVTDDVFCRDDDPDHRKEHHYIEYRADTNNPFPGEWPEDEARGNPDAPKWKSPLFMREQDTRIRLSLVETFIQRVGHITDEDIIREGIEGLSSQERLSNWIKLWDSINAKPKPVYSADKKVLYYESFPFEGGQYELEHRGKRWFVAGNPYVWVLSFRKQ